uniref:Uncharacterized protein n=1 Tax=Octopus bimaculoides TaxID=37653 RepID=A0A0L8GWB5_OCTBM
MPYETCSQNIYKSNIYTVQKFGLRIPVFGFIKIDLTNLVFQKYAFQKFGFHKI